MALADINGLVLTSTATATLYANRCVDFGGTLSVADGNHFGVCKNDAISGDKIPVVVSGTVLIEAGAAITAGDALKIAGTTTNAGRVIPWATSGVKIGIALSSAGAAGDLVEVLLVKVL